ncbi:D-alanine aminotransferase [Anatilimnocola aggregata]|uniref:D-alanine aminotransferase n=1 Tax=Anatilimnocola aggregata TaxID=2528021 RepID=A0A517YLM1_9BACT|nr:aminotransferase class IV [Anatilimnocola aggregata]QDU31119.1 D-alanine aminotransferase [Anatilimnocola aggregata]
MSEPIANLNGQWVPQSQALISVTDAGFVQGVTVAEQLRTFNGQLFELPRHLKRLARSLEIVGIDPGVSMAELDARARELAARNHALLQPGDDLGLSMFVTPGIYGTFVAAGGATGPTIGMHTYPLPFGSWVNKYEQGETLVLTDVRQVPNECWPAELKCRSRMHYYLADRRARQLEPGARAVMLDERGFVLEATTANMLIYRASEGIVSPPRASILPGVSVAILAELARELGIPWSERDLTVADVASADEILLCSTSPCVWPVTRFAGQPVSGGQAGPIAQQLLAAFSQRVGLDIAAQAKRLAMR